MVSRIVLVCVAGVAALAAAGCGGSADPGASLVAAFHPLAYALRQVAPAGSEVADLTGCREATVRVHLHRARAALAQSLDTFSEEITDGR